jgi:copper homeostasis protein
MKYKLEVCCGSIEDALVAQRIKADRIELNGGLELGGLTPSSGLLKKVKALVSLPILVMIRPHNGMYHYSELDFELMKEEAEILLKEGADGIVFGCLTKDGLIDEDRVKTLVEIAHGKTTVFHKAIDETEDIEAALQALIRCKVNRVLLGGGLGKIENHLDFIAELQKKYGHLIELLPGGGVHKDLVIKVIKTTKVNQIHMTGKRLEINPKTKTVHYTADETTLLEVQVLLRSIE